MNRFNKWLVTDQGNKSIASAGLALSSLNIFISGDGVDGAI